MKLNFQNWLLLAIPIICAAAGAVFGLDKNGTSIEAAEARNVDHTVQIYVNYLTPGHNLYKYYKCAQDRVTYGDPKRQKTCELMKRINGDINKLPEDHGSCYEHDYPARGRIVVTWNWEVKRFDRRFKNTCRLFKFGDGIFDI